MFRLSAICRNNLLGLRMACQAALFCLALLACSLGLGVVMPGRMAYADTGATPPAPPAPVKNDSVVGVEFVDPDNFTDAGISHGIRINDPQDVMRQMTAHLHKLGQRCLPAGAHLQLRVRDIRLAGEAEWWHRSGMNQEIRVMRDSTWPAMDIDFVLTDAMGAVLKQGKDHLSDPAYLQNAQIAGSAMDEFPYESHMIAKWYEKTFCGLDSK